MVSQQRDTGLVHRSVNACLCPLYAVEGMHVVTVEGTCLCACPSSPECCYCAVGHLPLSSNLHSVQVLETQGAGFILCNSAWHMRMAPSVASARLGLSCQCTPCSDLRLRPPQRRKSRTTSLATSGAAPSPFVPHCCS